MHPFQFIGVMGTARWKGDAGNRGRPVRVGDRGFNTAYGWWIGRESDRVVRPLRPGISGGGKDPDFWCAFKDGEEGVIGDEPGNARSDQEPSECEIRRNPATDSDLMSAAVPK